jgi:signal transduction histidine kinase
MDRQQLLEREILKIADYEKDCLGRELHDGLCQSLAGIAALSSALSRSLAASAQWGWAAAVEEIVRLLNDTISEARDLAHGFCPTGPHGAGLVGELETVARNVRRMHGVSCTFTWDCRCAGLGRDTERHLVRIVQEAVRNAIAHGRADRIDIRMERCGGAGLLSVRDNGVGLSEDFRMRDGIGRHTMNYRARAIGGSLTTARRPEGGTVVACAFPLPLARDLLEGSADDRPHG